MPEKSVTQVIQEHRSSLLTISGILGIGQGGSPHAPHISIHVHSKTSEILALVPSNLEGYPVNIKETGEIEAL